jgi:hypothetical protein
VKSKTVVPPRYADETARYLTLSLIGMTLKLWSVHAPEHPEVAPVVDEPLARRQKPVEVSLLGCDPDEEARPRVDDRVMAEDEDPIRRSAQESRDRADQRRLARAVRPEQPEERARRDPQLQTVECVCPSG